MLVVFQVVAAAAWADCGERLTFAPVVVPQGVPLPYGGSVRLDATVYCPEARGTSAAVVLDVGAVPIWAHHLGYFPMFRQQIGLQVEPAARGVIPGGPYVTARLGIAEILYNGTHVSVLPGIVFGYRHESRSGFTAQFGAGVEAWAPPWFVPAWPVVELRAGMVLGRPDNAPPAP